MNKAINDMLERYDCQSAGDYESALREIFQELALLGLWRGKFFEHAAFYGGTALRILYGLDRFSEDMDFSLLAPNPDFDLKPYCDFIEKELAAWGFAVSVAVKEKKRDSAIESAFLKAGTLAQLITVSAPDELVGRTHRNQVLRIKVEVDTDPPGLFSTESKYLLQPIPFAVRTYELPSLFAGKMHAVLFRKWGRRVKGRDWFDLVWYAGRGVPLDLRHLSERMRQTGDWDSAEPLSESELRVLLLDRINTLDLQAARADVSLYLKNQDSIAAWSSEFFDQVAKRIVVTTPP
jgi:hypothetical protein